MAVAHRVDLNHDAVLDANPFHELVGTEIVNPSLDFKVAGRLANNAARSMSITDQTVDDSVLRYLRRLPAKFKKVRARASPFDYLTAAPYGFGEQQ